MYNDFVIFFLQCIIIKFWFFIFYFKYILLALKFFIKSNINIEKLEYIDYICDKIMPIIKFLTLHIYIIQTKINGGIYFWWMILIYKNGIKTISILFYFGWKFIQKICFFHFLNNKCIIIFSFQNKTITIWKKKCNWACYVIFSFFFCLVMNHK